MNFLYAMPPSPPPAILGRVEFTADMVQTMADYFSIYAVDDVLTIEITEKGLWLPNPHFGGRQFLGLARLPQESASQKEEGSDAPSVQRVQ